MSTRSLHQPVRRTLLLTLAASSVRAGRASTGEPLAQLRSLQIIVPAPPGSQPDLIARWLAEPLARTAALDVVVANRPGASGAIAADAALQAPLASGPLLLAGLDHVAYSHVGTNRRALDPTKDFVAAGTVNRDHWLVATAADGPIDGLESLVELGRRTPVTYATTGDGTTPHLVAARLCRGLGIEATAVPYKDSYIPDLSSGRVHFTVAPVPALVTSIRSGRIRPVAVLSEDRLDQLPTVPTVHEIGFPDLSFTAGLFLFLPGGMATEAPRINAWLDTVLRSAPIRRRFHEAGAESAPASLQDTALELRARLARVDAMRLQVFGRSR